MAGSGARADGNRVLTAPWSALFSPGATPCCDASACPSRNTARLAIYRPCLLLRPANERQMCSGTVSERRRGLRNRNGGCMQIPGKGLASLMTRRPHWLAKVPPGVLHFVFQCFSAKLNAQACAFCGANCVLLRRACWCLPECHVASRGWPNAVIRLAWPFTNFSLVDGPFKALFRLKGAERIGDPSGASLTN